MNTGGMVRYGCLTVRANAHDAAAATATIAPQSQLDCCKRLYAYQFYIVYRFEHTLTQIKLEHIES